MVVLYLPLAFFFLKKTIYSALKSTPALQQAALWKVSKGNILKMLQFVIEKKIYYSSAKRVWLGLAWLNSFSVCWSVAWKRNQDQPKQVSTSPCSQSPAASLRGKSGDTAPGRLMAAQSWRVVGGHRYPLPSPSYYVTFGMEPCLSVCIALLMQCR